MKHIPFDEWLKYVKNDLDDKSRSEYENHLYDCDQCLELYLQAVEVNESSLPILSGDSSFTDLVMAEVIKKQQQQVSVTDKPEVERLSCSKTKAKKPFYQQAVFHYMLAAAATILLMFSGVFHSLSTYAGAVESPHFHEKRGSVTEGVINKTFAWMNSTLKKEADKK